MLETNELAEPRAVPVLLVEDDDALAKALSGTLKRDGYEVHAASDGDSEARDGKPRPLKEVMEEHERQHIVRALEFTKGNKRKAIEILKISPDTFYKRLEQFGLHTKNA